MYVRTDGWTYGQIAHYYIDYVKIMTLGNAVDFGNLLANRMKTQGSSNGHGGL